MTDREVIEIAGGGYRAVIVPSAGGLLRRLVVSLPGRDEDILHSPPDAVNWIHSPRFFGCWPMLPFANRAYDAVIDDGETRFTVPINDPPSKGAIHGFGWQAAWDVAERGPDRISLVHRRTEGPDPYRYVARQDFALSPAGLRLDLSITNEADRPLGYGFGLHPWFTKYDDTVLTLKATSHMRIGEGFRPMGVEPLPADLDFAAGQVVLRPETLTANFVGWDGIAEVATPSRSFGYRMEASDNMSTPLLWAPAGAEFFCLEPQSHVVGAPTDPVARAVTPLKRLAPGETMAGFMTLAGRAV